MSAVINQQTNNGQWWYQLIKSGAFCERMCRAIGLNSDFQLWIKQQPSCISKQRPSEYCFVDTRPTPDYGVMPSYTGVPLTAYELAYLNQYGQAPLLTNAGKEIRISVFKPTNQRMCELVAGDWFIKKALGYRKQWACNHLAYTLGYQSKKECPPATVMEWAKRKNVLNLIPHRLRAW